jgi:hypothetical protein
MNPEPSNVPSVLEPPATSAELCLYLIMILPEVETRRLHIKDFCRLYEIREKRTPGLENPLNQIAAYREQAREQAPLRGQP